MYKLSQYSFLRVLGKWFDLLAETVKKWQIFLVYALCITFLSAKIEKKDEDSPLRVIFDIVRTLDEQITYNSKGLVIGISDVAAVRPIREMLSHEDYGPYKIYIEPELEDWDVRIQLKNSYALDNGKLMTNLRTISGVTVVKEL